MRINQKNPSKGLNLAGGLKYNIPLKDAVVHELMANLHNEPTYYTNPKRGEVFERAAVEVPEFLAKAAIFAREQMHLRTAPVYIASLLVDNPRSRRYLPEVIERVCTRPDQLRDLVAAINLRDETLVRRIHGVGAGMRRALAKYDAYQLAKYKGGSGAVSLRDVLRIAHPKPGDAARSELYGKIVDGTLEAAETWEVLYSRAKSDKEKADVWRRLITEGRLPYMAALRNLRNMLDCGLDHESIMCVAAMISDPAQVKKARQYPYRYWSAYRSLSESPEYPVGDVRLLCAAVRVAADKVVNHVPTLNGETLVCVDVSGSMDAAVSGLSSVSRSQIARMYGAMLSRRVDARAVLFATNACLWNLRDLGVMDAMHMVPPNIGYATNGHLAVDMAITMGWKVDRIVFFTDMELWDYYLLGESLQGAMGRYWAGVNEDAYIHIVNLAPYGESLMDITDPRVSLISGYSDRLFEFISRYEEGRESMAKAVEAVELLG